ncbi:Signal peptide peptidase-like 2B [Lunasporangiospora selenospora]|uniref:Signal peptide peptidase-like 2B n=1 Tax=Lunasporangiospora selenospora TaxID=979761 RepID=A0A9P6FU91_9FUNG|nr:Signal peptide peptidase-like 2B [Lunasporangiospora selenospora]
MWILCKPVDIWTWIICFTITLMLRVLKAPSMSSPTLLLLSAFFYDVFFVFVTPYLTKTGESIMEAAATGAALTVQENIPMLFRIPTNILDSILAAAVATTPGAQSGGEAMLGFGDVVLPGILITFLKECDARLEEDSCLSPATSIGLMGAQSSSKARRWSYHLTAVLGYALGLEVTFVAMMWSQRGQPALLYLVPFTVLPVVLLASKRHELGLLWHGWGELDEKELSRSESTEWEKENEDVVVMEESKEGRETKQQRRVSLVRSSKISL